MLMSRLSGKFLENRHVSARRELSNDGLNPKGMHLLPILNSTCCVRPPGPAGFPFMVPQNVRTAQLCGSARL